MRGPRRRCLPARARTIGGVLLVTGLIGLGGAWVGDGDGPAHGQTVSRGTDLYEQHCATCHGTTGGGTYRGPSLVGVGAASADFYLRSGRMPIDEPTDPATRGQPAFDEDGIRALVDYVAALDGGPQIPEVAVEAGDLARGGELYRLHCAGCHNWDGKGGALIDANAPSLHPVPPTQVAEAIRIGPGSMPRFHEDVLDEAAVNDVVAYVQELRHPRDRGGFALAHWGPATETLAAVVALGLLLVVTGWLGERS